MNPEKTLGKPFVIVSQELPKGWLDLIKDECEILVGSKNGKGFSQSFLNNLDRADALFTLLTDKIDENIIKSAPKLRVVSNMAVGVDNINLKACTKRKIPVGNTPGVLTDGTADLTISLLLAISRRIFEASQDAKNGQWETWAPTGWLESDLNESVLGIIGMGKIGEAVAKRAHAFGLKIVYTSRSSKPIIENKLNAKRLDLYNLLSCSDYISLHVPLNKNTKGLINKEEFKRMKSNTYLINAARGSVVNTDSLYFALTKGLIAGAALDVTDPEPLPHTHPLYKLKNCLITPHIGSATWNTRKRMAELACLNILSGLKGEKLPHCANPEVYL